MNKKYLKPLFALALVCALTVGATLAYLTDSTDTVTNTFTVGDGVEITLAETTGASYTIIPGGSSEKDPTVALVEGSVDAYLFVGITEDVGTGGIVLADESTAVFSDYITYVIGGDWAYLGSVDNTFYYVYGTKDAATLVEDGGDAVTSILKDDEVTYDGDITNAMLAAIDGYDGDGDETDAETAPTLSFVAYAIQADNLAADDAITEFNTAFGIVFD